MICSHAWVNELALGSIPFTFCLSLEGRHPIWGHLIKGDIKLMLFLTTSCVMQILCLQYLIHEVVSGGSAKKAGGFFGSSDTDVPSGEMRQLENFFNRLAFFPHILDYRSMQPAPGPSDAFRNVVAFISFSYIELMEQNAIRWGEKCRDFGQNARTLGLNKRFRATFPVDGC